MQVENHRPTMTMAGKKKRAVLVATAGVLLIVLIVELTKKRPAPGSVEENYERLVYLRANCDLWREPSSGRDYFRLSTLRYYLAGKPSLKGYLDECEELQVALIKAGVYERREFKLERGLNALFVSNFLKTMSNSAGDQSWFLDYDDTQTNSVRITCRKLEMPSVSRVIRQLDGPK
jgi:hypothetical protein